MKKLLFFMALSLLLSACSQDFKFVRSGVIEKIEGNSIICNGTDNSLTDEVDCLFDETLAVGDTVNIYSDGDVLVASKADYANAQFILNNYGMSWAVREMPLLIPYCILLLLLAFVISHYYTSKRWVFPVSWLTFWGVVTGITLFSLLNAPHLEYFGKHTLQEKSAQAFTFENCTYPRNKVFSPEILFLSGKEFFIYQEDDNFYLIPVEEDIVYHPQEMIAKVNEKLFQQSCRYVLVCGAIFLISIIARSYFRKREKDYCKQKAKNE